MLEKFPPELDKLYRRIFAGLAAPGKRPGYICIIGETRLWNNIGERDLILLDEFEDFDLTKLIERAFGFDFRYRPERWLGDGKDMILRAIIRSENIKNRPNRDMRDFVLIPSMVLNNEKPIQYLYPILKNRLEGVGKLFLPSSLVVSHMRQINPEDIPTLGIGDYPAIEALAYAALELTRPIQRRGKTPTKCRNDYSRIK